jgi:hypothetical protein
MIFGIELTEIAFSCSFVIGTGIWECVQIVGNGTKSVVAGRLAKI